MYKLKIITKQLTFSNFFKKIFEQLCNETLFKQTTTSWTYVFHWILENQDQHIVHGFGTHYEPSIMSQWLKTGCHCDLRKEEQLRPILLRRHGTVFRENFNFRA